MIDTKSILASKGVWGGAIAVLAAGAGLFGYQVTPADTAELIGQLTNVVAAIGGAIAVYGRVVATKKIG